MRIAFLNLCHCDPEVVARVANILTRHPDFDMYIHVDAKTPPEPFQTLLQENPQVFFLKEREKIYWGGYNAIKGTFRLLREALASERKYDYFVTLQNLDYPIKSNQEIYDFFQNHWGREFIRGCKIAHSRDFHYRKKYKIYNHRDDDFYLKAHSRFQKYLHYLKLLACSITTIGSQGVVKEQGEELEFYYGAAQWAVTRECASYLDEFEKNHPKFNKRMSRIQFPDEEYFHTVVHNSRFRTHCMAYDEPEQRWLVNWRNLHYFEFPKEVTVFQAEDYERLSERQELFIRKVKSGVSEELMNLIDQKILKE